ncbi:MAG: hypothetical protein DMG96_15515 [Acidobacteria bacterium]|nr:MAG: hypothetical protein DMG96_15515 [Acidobacteriota bacterium]
MRVAANFGLKRYYGAVCVCCLATVSVLSVAESNAKPVSARGYGPTEWPQALRMADFILSLQNAGGAIPDEHGVITVNQDSNMDYALIGLAAAYEATRNPKYLGSFEKGIAWLADRQEMTDPEWKGTWYYVYSANPPYQHIPTTPGAGLTDARGVDATSALFAYLLYLDRRLTGNNTFAQRYSANARAALDFVINHNLNSDGLSRSSWQLHADDGKWHFYQEKYSADQGDVYLGMHAGELMYGNAKYRQTAERLKTLTSSRLFSTSLQRYLLGMDENGNLDSSDDGNSADFSQGYLSWIWGESEQSRAALTWLRSKLLPDGSVVSKVGAPAYSLNVTMLAMASRALAQPAPKTSLNWFIDNVYDSKTGGVYHDAGADGKHEYNNETAFCAIAFLGFLPFD